VAEANRGQDGAVASAPPIRVAAAGDVHADETTRRALAESFARVQDEADLVLLAGDLTTHGQPEQARVLADAAGDLRIPVAAVLGNHDYHCGQEREISAVLRDVGIVVLERDSTVFDVNGTQVGVVGTKGFVGGFPGAAIPDFGEPLLRALYAETTEEVKALARGLQAVEGCALRIVLLHYSPVLGTIQGEPEGIWAMLGSHRLALPITEHHPDLVVHGHAHEGTFEAEVGGVPVYNVAVQVMGRDFWIFDLEGGGPGWETPPASVTVEEAT
jgi:Icc-related predicted phosphoesterase